MSKDQESHAKNLEKSEEAKRKRETPTSAESAMTEGDDSAGASRAQVGGSVPSGSPQAVSAPTSRKRGAEDQLDPESTGSEPEASNGTGMQQEDSSDPLARSGRTKRLAEKDPEESRWRTAAEDGYRKADEANEQKLNLM